MVDGKTNLTETKVEDGGLMEDESEEEKIGDDDEGIVIIFFKNQNPFWCI